MPFARHLHVSLGSGRHKIPSALSNLMILRTLMTSELHSLRSYRLERTLRHRASQQAAACGDGMSVGALALCIAVLVPASVSSESHMVTKSHLWLLQSHLPQHQHHKALEHLEMGTDTRALPW
jgi:hypothetical protein